MIDIKNCVVAFSAVFAVLSAGCTEERHKPAPATLPVTVYMAKEIITMDGEQPRAEAVAISEGRIVAVGSREHVLSATPDATVIETFAEKVIVPGLIDQHLHPFLAATTLMTSVISIEEWVLPDVTYPAAVDHDDYMAKLFAAEAAMADPDEPLFTWGFHHYFHGKLTRELLDSVSTSRPILVWHRSAHEFILNSPAIELAGVTEEMVAAAPEEMRSQINLAEGHFWELGNFQFLLPRIRALLAAPERLLAGLQMTENYLHAAGVTTSAEPGGGSGDMYDLINSVLADEATPFRFYFIPDGRPSLAAGDVDLVARAEQSLAPVTARTAPLPKQVKLFSDGAMFSQLMQMQDGYTDGHHGEWLMPPELFAKVFREFWEAGYQIHIHQNGDAGLQMVLDNLEENLARHPREDHRTTIVHFGFSTAEQVDRIASLGAIVSANPYYTVILADRYSEMGIGPERANAMVRLGDVARAGVPFSFHSDMPMAMGRPLFLMWTAVNRITPSGRVAGPEQRISVEDALRAVTIDAAYSLRLEDEIGSITPGKYANLTILDNSPFDVDPKTIKDIGIWGTMLEGRLQPL